VGWRLGAVVSNMRTLCAETVSVKAECERKRQRQLCGRVCFAWHGARRWGVSFTSSQLRTGCFDGALPTRLRVQAAGKVAAGGGGCFAVRRLMCRRQRLLVVGRGSCCCLTLLDARAACKSSWAWDRPRLFWFMPSALCEGRS